MARIAAIVVAAALAATPAAAVAAQSNPFLPQEAPQEAPSTPQQAPPPAPVQQTDTDASLGGATVFAIALGIAGLLGGIWYVISRDARRATAGRTRMRTASDDPLAAPQGRSPTRAAPRSRKISAAERKRRKRGRAR